MNVWKKYMILIGAALSAMLSASTFAGGWRSRGEDCAPGTLNARAEWVTPFRQSKCLESLDCAGLAAYAEASRHFENARYLAIYQRPIIGAVSAPAATLAPATVLPTMESPAVAPPSPESTPVFPWPRVR